MCSSDLFRNRRDKQGRGKDIRYTLEVTFDEAIFGATKMITVPTEAAPRRRSRSSSRRASSRTR